MEMGLFSYNPQDWSALSCLQGRWIHQQNSVRNDSRGSIDDNNDIIEKKNKKCARWSAIVTGPPFQDFTVGFGRMPPHGSGWFPIYWRIEISSPVVFI